ncbi:MAG TPA: excalibur calcium-binding domain-containing protein [Gammaproteobacteria bacterium]|nr:excalibur calcium-binding domain-containing protein [Gammaproteobacteria bacterium]
MIAVLLLTASPVGYAKSCKAYRSCAEVVADYPDGRFGRRDGDGDGVPCENVCRSREQVERLLDGGGKSGKRGATGKR